jgi:hypothetical protein
MAQRSDQPAQPARSPAAAPLRWERWLTGPLAAALVLAGFWLLLVASVREKGMTMDEGVHVLGGTTFWRFNDYRINPENGNLPQRVMALPLAWRGDTFPPLDSREWVEGEKWRLAFNWFFQLGNDADATMLRGRAANALFAAALAALVWAWARRLFGPAGGMLSLLVCVLSPIVLANGPLMTCDVAAAFFFLASTGAIAAVLQRVTPLRLLTVSAAVAGLFVTKMSALLVVPIAIVLAAARLATGEPLALAAGRWRRELSRRTTQAAAFSTVALVTAAVTVATIWACHGFRYAAFAPGQPGTTWEYDIWESLLGKTPPVRLLEDVGLTAGQRARAEQAFDAAGALAGSWTTASRQVLDAVARDVLTTEQARRLASARALPPEGGVPRLLEWLREHRLLPEAYLYGYAHAWYYSRGRSAFFHGDYRVHGWRTFFLFAFLVKTPLPFFGIAALALVAAWTARHRGGNRAWWRAILGQPTLPLWTLFFVYWTAAIFSSLNIGHRHILATYPPLFVLCGAALAGAAPRRLRIATAVLLALLAAEMAWRFPNYIAYFNGIVRPAEGWRHLVDSSLDWGQDLPAVGRYLERNPPTAAAPVFLSYFGNDCPTYRHLPVTQIESRPGRDRAPAVQLLRFPADRAQAILREVFRDHPGIYDEDNVGLERDGDSVNVVLLLHASQLRLAAGTYIVSATMLQPILDRDVWGPWNARYEAAYQALRPLVAPLLSDDPAARPAALGQLEPAQWQTALRDFELLRFNRLTAYLRKRGPDDHINFSILVFRLSAAELIAALEGPPAELGPDLPHELWDAGGAPPPSSPASP